MTTLTVQDNNVQADSILLKLDALAQGYDEVLSMAKHQLDNYEITEQDWTRIASKVSKQIDLWNLALELGRMLSKGMDELNDNPDTDSSTAFFARQMTRHLLDRMEHRVKVRLIDEAVEDAVNSRFIHLRDDLTSLIDRRISYAIETQAMSHANKAASDRQILRDLLTNCLGEDLRSIAIDAARQINTTQHSCD